jgi:hypothetical protein
MTVFVWNVEEGRWVDGGEVARQLLIESIALMFLEHEENKEVEK